MRFHCVAFALILSALVPGAGAQETKPGGVETRSLAELRWLSELPPDLAVVLGWKGAGRDGMADVQESFNATGARDSRLPLRHFLLAGASANAALVAYEEGGTSDHRNRFRAWAYQLTNETTAWKQTGEWALSARPWTLRDLIVEVNFAANPPVYRTFKRTYPGRRDGPLREANLSDDEVREIQAVAHGVVPDAIVNISGVVTGCPCEEGAGCKEQVWIVAHRPGEMKGLQLSRVSGKWGIGPLQQWWLEYERIDAQRNRYASWTEFMQAHQKLDERYPLCSKVAAESAARKPVQPPPPTAPN